MRGYDFREGQRKRRKNSRRRSCRPNRSRDPNGTRSCPVCSRMVCTGCGIAQIGRVSESHSHVIDADDTKGLQWHVGCEMSLTVPFRELRHRGWFLVREWTSNLHKLPAMRPRMDCARTALSHRLANCSQYSAMAGLRDCGPRRGAALTAGDPQRCALASNAALRRRLDKQAALPQNFRRINVSQ
jgi:hypothetical protein